MAKMETAAPTEEARQEAGARFGARAVLAGLALALVAVPFGLLLFLVKASWSPLLRVDEGARDDLHGVAVRDDTFVTVMKALSFIGSHRVYLPVFALLAAWLAWRGRRRLAVFALTTITGSWLLNNLVKLAVDRSRPVLPDPVAQAHGHSFPSGHAQSAMVAYSLLLIIFMPSVPRPWRPVAVAAAAVMVAAIGFSRVALGVHYVSDVIAGYILGAAWVAAMTAAFAAWRREARPARAGRASGSG